VAVSYNARIDGDVPQTRRIKNRSHISVTAVSGDRDDDARLLPPDLSGHRGRDVMLALSKNGDQPLTDWQ